jgi:hypothetical protein
MRHAPSRALLGALLIAAALALPSAAAAAGGTLSTGLSGTNTSTSVTQTATTAAPVTLPTPASTGGGLTTLDYVLIALVVVILFTTIVYFVRRDAHLNAPRHAARDLDRGRGTVAPQTERVKRSRARAKAARKARRPRRN